MEDINRITGDVIGAAIEVHKALGPGLLELKAVKALEDVHTAQVLAYLKLGGYPVGLLINFNVKYLGEGAIRRLVSGYKGPLPRVP